MIQTQKSSFEPQSAQIDQAIREGRIRWARLGLKKLIATSLEDRLRFAQLCRRAGAHASG
ncbi:hypothetical protein WDW37_00645 [Bdellovibrionota bacterium FG-1]